MYTDIKLTPESAVVLYSYVDLVIKNCKMLDHLGSPQLRTSKKRQRKESHIFGKINCFNTSIAIPNLIYLSDIGYNTYNLK